MKKDKKVNNQVEEPIVLDIPEDEIWTYQIEGLAAPHINKPYKHFLLKKIIFVISIIIAVSLSVYFSILLIANKDAFTYEELSGGRYQLAKFSNTGYIEEFDVDYAITVEYDKNNKDLETNFTLVKDKSKKVTEIGKLANDVFSKFVSGQCLESVILGLIFFVILSICGFPYSLLISVLVAITSLIPFFGAFIALVIGAILIATQSFTQAIIFVLIFLVTQQIENNLIYPKVVGKSVGLSPLWTLLAITVGGSIFGIVGMIIGLPIASILSVLLKKDVKARINKRNLLVD